MQYAIFSNLDVLQRHICSNLEWNGKNESQVVFEDEEDREYREEVKEK